ncbi:MAG: MinD/ParA family ATP-binding protein, partial [Nitrospiraceae bacterium]
PTHHGGALWTSPYSRHRGDACHRQYAVCQELIRNLRKLDADIILIDVGAGTGYHALDFFLMADHHIAVTTPDPTSVLDLYRFIKLAAIRRVLSEFHSRHPAAAALADRDFSSIEEVLTISGSTDEVVRAIATKAVSTFCPSLVLNRIAGTGRVNVLHLRKLLKEYVGSDLALLGEVPEDPAVERSVRSYLPVVESAPQSPAARAFAHMGEKLMTVLDGEAGNAHRVSAAIEEVTPNLNDGSVTARPVDARYDE